MTPRIAPLARKALLALALAVSLPGMALAAEPAAVGGYPPGTALKLGEAMYRTGIRPSGEPLRATVQGDIEITGTMSTCMNCHLRSGLGTVEGGVLSPPTNGARLYAPIRDAQDIPGSAMKRSMFKKGRPAYTRETLARVFTAGVGAAGKPLAATMPLYDLSAQEVEILVYYLEHLSAQLDPGVGPDEIRFAAVVSDRVPPGQREALIAPLKAFVAEEWSARLPSLNARPGRPVPGAESAPPAGRYRNAALEVWELTGAPEGWEAQLEALYRQKPVFALLGGVVPGKWEPVHRFCEKNGIPCIFPLTELPVVSERDWYTLYVSKGYYQEGETAAKYLSRVFALPPGKRLVQLLRDDAPGRALARGFADVWQKLGSAPLAERVVRPQERVDARFWQALAAEHPDAVFLAWLPPSDLSGIEALAASPERPSTVFLSGTLLGGAYGKVPERVREFALVTHPTRLPGDGAYARQVADSWLSYRKIAAGGPAAYQSYLVTRLLSRVLVEMGGNLYRDYFLDLFDDGKDETNASVLYPKLSFGPGQRYAAKGCYVVALGPGENPQPVRRSDWIVY